MESALFWEMKKCFSNEGVQTGSQVGMLFFKGYAPVNVGVISQSLANPVTRTNWRMLAKQYETRVKCDVGPCKTNTWIFLQLTWCYVWRGNQWSGLPSVFLCGRPPRREPKQLEGWRDHHMIPSHQTWFAGQFPIYIILYIIIFFICIYIVI